MADINWTDNYNFDKQFFSSRIFYKRSKVESVSCSVEINGSADVYNAVYSILKNTQPLIIYSSHK